MAKSKREIILDNLDNIEKWCAEGKKIRWIAQQLGVSKTLLYNIMAEDREFNEVAKPEPPKVDKRTVDKSKPSGLLDAIKKGREVAVEKIESAMFDSAIGFTKKVKKYQKVKKCIYENGKKAKEWEEMVEYEEDVYFPPDNTAGIFLLKNWGKYANEPVTIELRKKELELKEKQVNATVW